MILKQPSNTIICLRAFNYRFENFEGIIDLRDLFKIFFSDSTFENERITNQAGEFIIHGFIGQKELAGELNERRFSENHRKVLYLINDVKKEKLRKQLKMLGVKKNTIDSSLAHTVDVIYDR